MNNKKHFYPFGLSITLFALSLFLFSSSVAHAMSPSLSLTNNGDGDTVTVNVTGDTNVSVLLFYNKTGVGAQTTAIGTTNASGVLSLSISTSQYGINPSSSVYVTTNGINGPQSNSVIWPISSSSSSSSTITLSQTAVALAVGSSSTITANGATSLYLLSNSSPSIANINLSTNQITISAINSGSTTATVCSLTNTASCGSISIVVQNAGATSLAFSQNNLSIAQGQNIQITVSGGSGAYTVFNNPNPSTVGASINGNIITFIANASSGSDAITICSTDMSSCGVVTTAAESAASSGSALTFSPSNPVLSIGQTLGVIVSGGTGVYSIPTNLNPSVVQSTIANNLITLTAVNNGTSTITVCSTPGGCGYLIVVVTGATVSNSAISISPNSVSVLIGQTFNVTILGGTAPYIISNPSPNIVESSLNGNVITVDGLSLGSASINVCSTQGQCTPLYISVSDSSSTSTSGPTVNPNSLSVIAGQSATTAITGNGTYYVSNNTNPTAATAQITSNVALVTGISSGSTNISICQTGGQCTNLSVSVNNSSTPTTTTTLPQGCTTTIGYSAVTGQACSAITLPQGCSASTGYSTTTGQSCAAQTTTTTTPPTSTTSAYVFARYLGYGDTGDDVLALQQLLTQLGFFSTTPNGRYGPATIAGVEAFQTAHNINPVGVVGPATKTALNLAEAGSTSTSASATTSTTANTTQTQQIEQEIQQLQAQLQAME